MYHPIYLLSLTPFLIAELKNLDQLQPMKVVFRLAGLLEEATEQIISSLQDSSSDSNKQPEVKFKIARVLVEKFDQHQVILPYGHRRPI